MTEELKRISQFEDLGNLKHFLKCYSSYFIQIDKNNLDSKNVPLFIHTRDDVLIHLKCSIDLSNLIRQYGVKDGFIQSDAVINKDLNLHNVVRRFSSEGRPYIRLMGNVLFFIEEDEDGEF